MKLGSVYYDFHTTNAWYRYVKSLSNQATKKYGVIKINTIISTIQNKTLSTRLFQFTTKPHQSAVSTVNILFFIFVECVLQDSGFSKTDFLSLSIEFQFPLLNFDIMGHMC